MDLVTEKTAKVPTDGHRGGTVTSSRQAMFTVPTLAGEDGTEVAAILQQRLVSLIDLALTLKHIHWNVVGPNFIAVHEMIDVQHTDVALMTDTIAERIATLGGVPRGLPGQIVQARTWTDYGLDRADALSHLGALDIVYQGIIADHRHAIHATDDIDPVSQDLLIGQTGALERFHWFVRSHLANWAGGMSNAGARSEIDAARAVAAKASRNATRVGDGR